MDDMRGLIDLVSTELKDAEQPNQLLKFVENCLFLESQSHHWHLQSRIHSEHVILDELYKELPEYVDSFIEDLMKTRGPVECTKSDFSFQGLEYCIPILGEFVTHCKYVLGILESEDEVGTSNSLEDLISFVDSIIYKLTFLK